MENKSRKIKYFKIGGIVFFGYILFSCSTWIGHRVQSEKEVREFCMQINGNIEQTELIHLIELHQNLRFVHLDANRLMIVAKEMLPETPSCHIELKNNKVEKVRLFDARQRIDIKVY